jgi:hypothetical protein
MWAVGNGESRLGIDVNKLSGPKSGCNAIYRNYQIDYITCVDRRMMNECLNAGANITSLLYTRPEWYGNYKGFLHVRELPELPYTGSERWDEPFQWGSGPYAVLLAAKYAKEKYVNLIGFDLYSKTQLVNNVYKGTSNYDEADKRAIDPRYWIHQIGMVFKCFPKINFTLYQDKDWELPKAWIQPNVKVDNISNIYYNT